jgi:hypothetical protein
MQLGLTWRFCHLVSVALVACDRDSGDASQENGCCRRLLEHGALLSGDGRLRPDVRGMFHWVPVERVRGKFVWRCS